MNDILFSSKNEVWSTPQWLFDELDARFHFTLDPCATKENAKCAKFYTAKDNGLSKDWGGETVFCNPPYGRKIVDWVKKCSDEAKKNHTRVVMLLPARTDTRWFHEYIYHHAEIEFLKGRLKFSESRNPAPFPSMIVIFS